MVGRSSTQNVQEDSHPRSARSNWMSGDIALYQGKPVVHIHGGSWNGTTQGGHVLEAYVAPTLEVMVTEDPVTMQKRFDPATDLTLIDPAMK